MNGGIFVHCCPCCFADGVMSMPVQPFCFADGEDVAPLSRLLRAITTGLCVFRQLVPILTVHECTAMFQPCRERMRYYFCWWTGKGCVGLHRKTVCVMPYTLASGNPPYVLHRCKGLCGSMLCTSMISTLLVLQERKSVHVCVFPPIIGHGLCNERF